MMSKNLEYQLHNALEEISRLRGENSKLKGILKQHNISYKVEDKSHINKKSEIIHQRINIFKNLFKGRKDVYPFRWESRNGQSGYSPACQNEWHPILCNKPNVKCSECSNSAFVPLTDKAIFKHLSGDQTIGIYPILQDDTCYFLAVDFDKSSWQEDASTFVKTCDEYYVPATIERSRSGNGCHVWIFFDEAIKASLARKLGNFLMNKTLEKRYQMGLDSYDRMFPNQDTLPQGGFGNLIALPLQGEPRKHGNSVFVNESFEPYENQWEYLSKTEKLNKNKIVEIVKNQIDFIKETKQNRVINELNITIQNGVTFEKSELPSSLAHQLIEMSSFNNPEFYKAQSRRLSTYNIPRKINCSDQNGSQLILPRGIFGEVKDELNKQSIKMNVVDKRRKSKQQNLTINFVGSLLPQQQEAVEELLNHTTGILSATTGFGKTVVGAALISKRQVNTLVIVNRKQLLKQWKDRLLSFLDIDVKSIGQIGAGKNKPTGIIDVATIQTLTSKSGNLDLVKQYDQVIVDECHHFSALTFEKVLKEVEAKYVHGLTATPIRKDGLQPIMKMQCGPIRYKVNARQQANIHTFDHILIPRYTSFKSKTTEKDRTIQSLYKELVLDDKRNDLIFNDVLEVLEEGRSPIILSERREHIQILEQKFRNFAKNIVLLIGGLGEKEEQKRLEQLKQIPSNEERIIIATGKYIGEGFDDARLDTLFLTMPVSWRGTLQQYVGRLHRSYGTKQNVKVYDYVDKKESILQDMFDKRLKGYKSLGYKFNDKLQDSNNQLKLF
jgi:superfamily II DNA or RNA helicase